MNLFSELKRETGTTWVVIPTANSVSALFSADKVSSRERFFRQWLVYSIFNQRWQVYDFKVYNLFLQFSARKLKLKLKLQHFMNTNEHYYEKIKC